MVLNSQQHNAIVYENPSSDAEAARAEKWFGMLAERVTSGQEACGFPLSDVVARHPSWRKPIREWKKAYRSWILQADERTLTAAALFFDLRGIYGSLELVDTMKRDIVDALNVQAMDTSRHFFKMMAANALSRKPPVSFLGRFQLERRGEHRGTFDIRERGVLPVVDAMRVLALEHRYLNSTNTFNRLSVVGERAPELSGIMEETVEAYRYLVDFRLEDQLTAFENGEKLDNQIEPLSLRKVQQNLLRNVFGAVTHLQEAMADRYGLRR
jgi:CBS domain-containing protein